MEELGNLIKYLFLKDMFKCLLFDGERWRVPVDFVKKNNKAHECMEIKSALERNRECMDTEVCVVKKKN